MNREVFGTSNSKSVIIPFPDVQKRTQYTSSCINRQINITTDYLNKIIYLEGRRMWEFGKNHFVGKYLVYEYSDILSIDSPYNLEELDWDLNKVRESIICRFDESNPDEDTQDDHLYLLEQIKQGLINYINDNYIIYENSFNRGIK